MSFTIDFFTKCPLFVFIDKLLNFELYEGTASFMVILERVNFKFGSSCLSFFSAFVENTMHSTFCMNTLLSLNSSKFRALLTRDIKEGGKEPVQFKRKPVASRYM